MNSSPCSLSADSTDSYAHRLVIVALIASAVTFLIAAFYPSGRAADYPSGRAADVSSPLSFGAAHGWLAAQSFALVMPGLVFGLLVGKLLPRVGAWVGTVLMLAVPVIVLCDVIAFTLIAERFLSDTTMRIGMTLLPGVWVHVSRIQIMIAISLIAFICLAIVATCVIAGAIGRRWHATNASVNPWVAAFVFAGVAFVMSIPALSNSNRVIRDMGNLSARHPFCAFHLVGYHGTGLRLPSGDKTIHPRLRGLQAAPAVFRRDAQLRDIQVVQETNIQGNERPDVMVVVIESFRPEMISPEIMPNLTRFAEQSIWCRNHFSGGNATCYGMFSLFTGLEAIWFNHPVRSEPVLNRLLRQTGYETAFFGAHESWAPFGMTPFVRPEVFDRFHLERAKLPSSDTQTVERSCRFIDRENLDSGKADALAIGSEQSREGPKAVVTFLFGTHLYESYSDPSDRIFQPAQKADFPHSYSPDMKQRVVNCYKNSFRTMDRIIAPLLRDDCVVMVVGDHGESLLDDGTNIHGTRLSRFQNMTPAVIGYPGVSPRVIESPTMHADMLPTLLSILDIPVTPSGALDGVDLVTAKDETLSNRSFVTCAVVDGTSMLVGPWTLDPDQPFGHRFFFNIEKWHASYLNPIDERGLEWEAKIDQVEAPHQQWVIDRFGAGSYTDATEAELFTSLLRSEDPRVQKQALRIARDVSSPEPYLYDLIVETTATEDPGVRGMAKEIVIRWHRASGGR